MTHSPLDALREENIRLKEEISRLRKKNLFLDIISSDNFDIIANNLQKNNQPASVNDFHIGDKVQFIYKKTLYDGSVTNLHNTTKIGVDVVYKGIALHWKCDPKSLKIV